LQKIVVYPECYANARLACDVLKEIGINIKKHHKSIMNFDRVLSSTSEVFKKNDFNVIIFLDKEIDEKKKRKAEQLVKSISIEFEHNKMDKGRGILVYCFYKEGKKLVVVFLEGGFEEAMIKYGAKRGEIEKYKEKLKSEDILRGSIPQPLRKAYSSMLDDVINQIKKCLNHLGSTG